MTDAEDPRVLRAARIVRDEGSARPILVGHAAEIAATAATLGMSLDGMDIVDPDTSPLRRGVRRSGCGPAGGAGASPRARPTGA